MSVASPLISLLSKSKYTTRLAKRPACGPAASWSTAPPLALAPPAPLLSASLLPPLDAAAGAGLGGLLAQADRLRATPRSSTVINRRTDTFSSIPILQQRTICAFRG